jgi:thiol-disulfide isomerase/thioredoxin
MMHLKLAIAVFILIFAHSSIRAQSEAIPVVGFSEFNKKLTSNSDTVYIINFWATWCAPCRKEIPQFEQIHKDYSGNMVKVLLVSLDFPNQKEKALKNFVTSNKVTAPVILLNEPDANSWIDKVDPSWSGAIPATLIFRKDNRKFFEKELTYEDIKNSIISLSKL